MKVRTNLPDFCLGPGASIRDAIRCIDREEHGIALVVDDTNRLLDTVTDGDVRRAILAGVNLENSVSSLRGRRATSPYPRPVTASVGTAPDEVLRLMRDRSIRQIPLLDADDRVVGLVTMRDLLASDQLPIRAVVMAGGYGTRLRPLTQDLPKPMLPVGDKPLLERIVAQLRDAGVRHVNLATHYKGEMISSHFGDGRKFGVEIGYLQEDHPLGTAGALSLLRPSEDPVLVINGDILTRVNFRAMLDFHRDHGADMTVAVRLYEVRVPYGVLETDGIAITGISEKPMVRHFVNAGIYLLNPDVRRYIPTGQRFDMPDLISELVADRRRVISFPVREYWLDIGQAEDYEQARADVSNRNC